MSERQFELASTAQMDQREAHAEELYAAAFDPDELPWFVSDEASLWDIYGGKENDLIHRCQEHYGVRLRREQFGLQFWRLLDYLQEQRIR